MKFKEGDYVRVIEREHAPTDVKNGTFYPHFCGLTGTVERVYDEGICLKVDCEALPESLLKRHLEIQESIKNKWLNGLSGETRNKLTAEEKRFELSYTILVQVPDIEKAVPVPAAPAAVKKSRPVSSSKEATSQPEPKQPEADSAAKETSEKLSTEMAVQPAPPSVKHEPKSEVPRPVTSDDLTEAELAFLEEKRRALQGEE